MPGRLAFSLNDDGTVTLRCDADRFFAHANTIRQLLAGPPEPDEEPDRTEAPDAAELDALWVRLFPPSGELPRCRDISRQGLEVLAAGHYLTRERGFASFGWTDLQRVLEARGSVHQVKAGTLIHLARRGWLERVQRGAYALARRGVDRLESLGPPEAGPSSGRPRVRLPRLVGLSRFLREVPANRKWRRVLLVIYFLREHAGVEEIDHRLLAACFQRLRGFDAPGSLSALVSQTLAKRHGLLEKGSRRGSYRLTARALEDLRKSPRVVQADAIQRSQLDGVAATG